MKSNQQRFTHVFLALALIVSFVFAAASVIAISTKAYADETPSYTLTMTSTAETLQPGDTFTVTINLSCDGATEFQMYAFTTVLRYNSDMLELTDSTTPTNVDLYTTALDGDYEGFTDITTNYLTPSLQGTTWDSPRTVMTLTFNVKTSGYSKLAFKRVNVSNTSGMGSYPCTCTDMEVTAYIPSANFSHEKKSVEPSTDASDATTTGTAAEEVDTSKLPSAPMLLLLTDEERKELEESGYDITDMINRALAEGLISEDDLKALDNDQLKALEDEGVDLKPYLDETTLTEIGTSGDNPANNSGAIVAGVVIAIIVIAAVIGTVVYFARKKKSE